MTSEQDKGAKLFCHVSAVDFAGLEIHAVIAKAREVKQTIDMARSGEIQIGDALDGIIYTLAAPTEDFYSK